MTRVHIQHLKGNSNRTSLNMNIGSTRKLHACFGFPRKGQSRGTVTVKSAQDPYNVGGEDASSLVGSEITSIDPEVFRQHVQLVWNVNKVCCSKGFETFCLI